MTFTRLAACVLVALSAFIVRPALAQRFGSRTNSLTSLAANDAVQKHLGLSSETAAKLNSHRRRISRGFPKGAARRWASIIRLWAICRRPSGPSRCERPARKRRK